MIYVVVVLLAVVFVLLWEWHQSLNLVDDTLDLARTIQEQRDEARAKLAEHEHFDQTVREFFNAGDAA